MSNSEDRPKVGVGVMILKEGKVLLGKRNGSHGAGEYCFPGGHLEYMETIENCAKRETLEECGVEIKNVVFQYAANVMLYAPKHYFQVGVMADWKAGEPKILEPDKFESWGWYDLNALPKPIFELSLKAIESCKTGVKYYDISAN